MSDPSLHRLPGPDGDRFVPSARVPRPDGTTVAVHHLAGSGEPACIVHATGFCGPVYASLAREMVRLEEALGVSRSWWAIDVRGHGRTPPPDDGDLGWDGGAADVALATSWIAERAGTTQPMVAVGHSMGGALLLIAAASDPDRFGALWLFEPIVFPPDVGDASGGNPLAEGARRRRPDFSSREDAIANYSGKPPLNVFSPEVMADYVDGGFAQMSDGTITLRCRPEHEGRTFEGGGAHRGWSTLGQVACPVVVARGDDSGPPATLSPAIASRLPSGQLIELPGLGHFGPMQDPARVAAEVVDYFGAGARPRR